MNRAYVLSYCLRFFSILMILACAAVLLVGARSQSSPTQTGQNLNKQVVEEITGPIVDYEIDSASIARHSKERSLRETRRLRYVKRAPVPLGELPDRKSVV
jgi:hypothetical protein